MKVISINKTATVIIIMIMGTVIPVNAEQIIDACTEQEEYIEPTAEEYVICDDSESEIVEGADIQTITDFSVKFSRTSPTTAKANVEASTTSKSITSKVQLQKYVSSKSAYANVKGISSTKTVSSNVILHTPKFSVTSNGKYRVKVMLTSGSSTIKKYKKLV